MPSTKQAKKRVRQNEERRVHNKTMKSACKTQIKKVTGAIEAGDREKAEKELSIATSRLYKASSATSTTRTRLRARSAGLLRKLRP